MSIYTPKHFDLRELVDQPLWDRFGDRVLLLMDPDALRMLDGFRDTFGPIVVNDWHRGGKYHESGLRLPHTDTGSKLSMHKYGRAFDSKPKSCTPKDMYDVILKAPHLFPLVRRLENITATPTWLHADTLGRPGEPILVVNP